VHLELGCALPGLHCRASAFDLQGEFRPGEPQPGCEPRAASQSHSSNPFHAWWAQRCIAQHAVFTGKVITTATLVHLSMAGLLTLLSLSTVMAAASFLAGILPLSLTLSQSQLRLISTVGMGVLVGTSLIIIIPEGVETLYSASSSADSHQRRDLVHFNTLDVRWAQPPISLDIWQQSRRALGDDISPFDLPGPLVPDSFGDPPKTPTKPGVVGALSTEDHGAESSKQEKDADHHDATPHAWVGIALVSGFILMYLIDKLPQYTNSSKPKTRTHHIALNNLSRRFNLTTTLDREEEADSFLETTQSEDSRNRGFATTTGLVIHAAADGIALGASSVTSHTELSFIIFFAIMVHKAPAAFGLTSILLKQGLSKRTARAHLFLFSLAAPAGAVLTWILAHVLGGYRGRTEQGTTFWTGMLLLFSGGTFLYVAMHAMQETSDSHHQPHQEGRANGYIEGGRDGPPPEQKASLKDLGAACFGMILPLFLQIGHAH
jgi:solute carrier family 39 (zinc transporter), member 9